MQAEYEKRAPEAERSSDDREPPEELRLLILLRMCEIASADPSVEVRGRELAGDLEMPLETAFSILEYLSRKGDLEYLGAGPRVRLTSRGASRLGLGDEMGRWRRGPSFPR